MTIEIARDGKAASLTRDDVYRAVVEKIVSGQLRPGHRLSERTLAASLGVSRTPIKEAVRRLENEGFVRTAPRQGIVVATSAQDSVLDAVRVRAVLEGLAARLVADTLSCGTAAPDTRRVLSALLAEIRRASRSRDVDRLRAVNADFHAGIRQACGNRYVVHMSSAVLAVDSAVRRRALADRAEMRRGEREHLDIGRYILDGDAAAAEQAMRAHILRSGQFVLDRAEAASEP